MANLAEKELARKSFAGLTLRPQALRVAWRFEPVVTQDGHDARCILECSVRAIDHPAERGMLQEVLLNGKQSVTTEDVVAHFHRPLQSALSRALQARGVADALSDAGRHSLAETLKSAAHPIAFSCGVELLAPFHVEIESASYEQHRLRELQRSAAERQAAGQVEHFQRAAELLKQFQAIRQAAPDLSAGQVLQQINPADRGSVLQTLLLASAQKERATSLWAVSGEYLVRIDTSSGAVQPELIPLPPTAGPLRSVQPDVIDSERVLLVGAQKGFIVVRPGSTAEPQVYRDPGITSDRGFSSVRYWPARQSFVGCHADAGVVLWLQGELNEPASRLPKQELENFAPSSPSPVPRDVQLLADQRIVFGWGNLLMGMGVDGGMFYWACESESQVVAIVPAERSRLVAHADGTVFADLDSVEKVERIRRKTGHRIVAAGRFPWLDSTRLLLATDAGPVQCIGLDDPLVTQYGSAHRGVCVVAGSHDLVAAVSPDRQRLILWNAWDGSKPVHEIYLSGTTRHRIADIDFG